VVYASVAAVDDAVGNVPFVGLTRQFCAVDPGFMVDPGPIVPRINRIARINHGK
jgi:hypothetical protein